MRNRTEGATVADLVSSPGAGPGTSPGTGRPDGPDVDSMPGEDQVLRAARLRRRRRLLLLSAPVVLLVLLVAIKLLSLPVFAQQAGASFAAGNGTGTRSAGQALDYANVVESWKAPFALGDGLVLNGDLTGAREAFERALAGAPEAASCMVRVNLVLTLEKLGDVQLAAGDSAAAKALYDQGIAVAAQAPPGCFLPAGEGNRQGEGNQLRQSQQRLEQKSQQAGQQPSATPAPTQNPEQGGSPAEQGKLDQLREQQQQAQQDRAEGGQLDQDLQDGPGSYSEKRW
jgi:tetratricopeptide (TPR) repeat protein